MSTTPNNPYVMVPVPIEHRTEMEEFVMRLIIRDGVLRWDLPAVEELLAGLEPRQRAFLQRLTERSSQPGLGTVGEYAVALGMEPDEVVAMVHELNTLGQEMGKAAFVILDDQDPLHAFISPHIAQLLREADAFT